jgi:hypothetical protein
LELKNFLNFYRRNQPKPEMILAPFGTAFWGQETNDILKGGINISEYQEGCHSRESKNCQEND